MQFLCLAILAQDFSAWSEKTLRRAAAGFERVNPADEIVITNKQGSKHDHLQSTTNTV